MIGALIAIFSNVAAWLISLLPAGPTIPESAGDLIRNSVAFLKGLNLLLDIPVELTVLTSIFVYLIAKAGFKGAVWVYKIIRGG